MRSLNNTFDKRISASEIAISVTIWLWWLLQRETYLPCGAHIIQIIVYNNEIVFSALPNEHEKLGFCCIIRHCQEVVCCKYSEIYILSDYKRIYLCVQLIFLF